MRSILIPALLMLAACSPGAPGGGVAVPAVTLETHTVALTTLPQTHDWDGRIEAIERATLAAQTGGRVADLPVDVGDVVEEGTVVVRFTAVEQQSGQHQAQAALEAARAHAIEVAATFRRIEEVYARKLVARAEYDRARAAHDAAQAQLAAARAGLKAADQQVGYTAIRAPYRGVVTARHAEPGETVSPGQPLLSGMSLDRLRLVVDVPQAQAARIVPDHAGTRAFVLTDDGRRVAVTRITVFPQADDASHTVRVRLDLPENESGLAPGMSAKAVFELGETQAVSVPVSALARRGEVESVFVVQPDGLIALRQVRSGRRLDDAVEILAGLTPGDAVAADAAAALAARHAQRARMARR